LILLALTVFYISGIAATLDAGKSMYYNELEIIESVHKEKKSTYEKNLVYVGRTQASIFLSFTKIQQ